MMSKTFAPMVFLAASLALLMCDPSTAQVATGRPQAQTDPRYADQANHDAGSDEQVQTEERRAEEELQEGTALTRGGNFSDAIPHLLAAQGKVHNQYAASFNLALCYVGIGQYERAISLLNDIHREGPDGADVENLLAQSYVGNGQTKEALASFEKAALATPQSEKLYLLVADACMEHQEFSLGLKVVDIGLNNLPQSARLHYQRGIFLSQLDQFDRARTDFERASDLAGGSEIGSVSRAYEKLLAGDIAQAIHEAREGINKGSQNPILLTVLGQALLRSGIAPGQLEFSEAQTALSKAVSERPSDTSSQIALGQIYLASGRLEDAISYLEKARKLRPRQPAIYASLAKAYQRHGDAQKSQEALATLEMLNQAQAERIRSAPGDSKVSYGAGEGVTEPAPPHQ